MVFLLKAKAFGQGFRWMASIYDILTGWNCQERVGVGEADEYPLDEFLQTRSLRTKTFGRFRGYGGAGQQEKKKKVPPLRNGLFLKSQIVRLFQVCDKRLF